jgi:hypothetical protein
MLDWMWESVHTCDEHVRISDPNKDNHQGIVMQIERKRVSLGLTLHNR